MKKFTAVVVVNDTVTDNKIQCIGTDETYKFFKVWIDPKTEKKYYITKMYNKSCFIEIQ